jgi:multidrug efflux pump subunit AcrA (membrane-fusion protein)
MSHAVWRRPIVVVPAAIVIVGAAAFFGLRSAKSNAANPQASTDNEQLYTVQPTTMQQTVSASGTIEPAETDDLSFTSAGTVTAVNVKAGQKVKKGAVLATIDSAALQSALQQANAGYQSARAQLADDEAASASSAQISSDQANVGAQQANVVAAYTNLLGASLRSPIDGTIATVDLTVGQTLSSTGGSGTDMTGTGNGSGRSPSTGSDANGSSGSSNGNGSNGSSNSSSPQIEVVSDAFVVDLSVDTATVGKVKVGQTATVTPTTSSGTSRGNGGFAGFVGIGGFANRNSAGGANSNSSTQTNAAVGASATGTVTSVGTVASSSSGVATFPVVITVDGTPNAFHDGASASAAIVYIEKANVLAVPVTAITQSGGRSYVTVSANGKTSKRTVTTGTTANGQVEITSGVRAGEQVVITLPNFARNGSRTGNGNTTGGQSPGGGVLSGGGQFPAGGSGGPKP